MAKANEKLKKKIGFVSLGCDKNRVDTENIITSMAEAGFEIVSDENAAQIIIINTCGFLASARDEAFKTIEEISQLKSKNLEKLIVAGCLAPALKDIDGLKQKLPLVDSFIKFSDYENIAEIIYDLYNLKHVKPNILRSYRKTTTPSHYAYLKIADGCSNGCAYCKIPSIRGKYISIPIEKLTAEAKLLAKQGVKELILVAQDVTRYGTDLYKTPKLTELLQALSKIDGITWIRLHYCYPEMIDPVLINEIKTNPKIVKYLDIPFQHISSSILKAMNRRSNEQSIRLVIEMLRQQIPEISIRTTFMIGFPGETKKDFKKLCRFLKEYKLNNVGFFAYSREEGTPSYNFSNQVKEKVKQKRLKAVQKIQAKIAEEILWKKLGKTVKIMCDRCFNENSYIGRDYTMSPEVDFEIEINSNKTLINGEIYDVKIVTIYDDNIIHGEIIVDN